MSRDGYEAWRKTIPWTTEQIAQAMVTHAAEHPSPFIRDRIMAHARRLRKTGRLSARSLSLVINRLITTCAACGKRALYRSGSVGMCREHRYLRSNRDIERNARKGEGAMVRAEQWKAADAQIVRQLRYKRTKANLK